MTRTRSTALYPHPFSKSYWRDAAGELKITKMLVVTALLVAMRIVLKPLAIPLGPQLKIQTAMLATALGSMIFGPVVAIPAAIISDTIGFMLFPQGDYFLPFVLTEIASTMIYSLLLYRAEVSTSRVMISRFLICLLVNIIMYPLITAWQHMYNGMPEKAAKAAAGILQLGSIFKNLFAFPLETVVLTVFLKALVPVTRRAKLTFSSEEKLGFTKKQIAALVCLTVIGIGSAIGYLTYRYNTTSRSADFSPKERIAETKEASQIVQDQTSEWDDETVIGIVSKANRPLFAKETAYTIDVYILDQAVFDAQAAEATEEEPYTMDTVYGYSLTPAKKDAALIRVATVTYTQNEKTGEVIDFVMTPWEE